MKVDFYDVLEEVEEGMAYNPYAGKTSDGKWIQGMISIDWLNNTFGKYGSVEDMKKATANKGTLKYLCWLRDKGILN